MSDPSKTSVFIVGGGPSGLAMALLLDRFGIDCVVVERNATTTDHPKSRGVWVRTMELFRQWGIEERIRARGLPSNADVFAFVESMAGKEFGRTRPEPDAGYTPAWKSPCAAQDAVEEEIYKLVAESRHARVFFSTEFLSFEESPNEIRVRCRSVDTGKEREWSARYLIAADGAASQARRCAGIEMLGPANLGVMSNEYWHGDLSQVRSVRETAVYVTVPNDPAVPQAVILNTNGRDRWLTVTRLGDEKDERDRPWTDAEFIAMTRRHAGVPSLDVKLVNRSVWRVSRQVAGEFSRGRVFLIGDAAHRFPPSGGYGMNSGVQDAHNLAWKLAFVLRGIAAERLLESYSVERRPIAESNANFSFGNMPRFASTVAAIRSGNADELAFRVNDFDNHLHSIGQSLGVNYEAGAVIHDGTVPRGHSARFYVPSDRPGGRFPHLWLDLARTQSTLDWFDREFVLVTGPLGQDWCEAGKRVAAKLEVPLSLRSLPTANPNDGFLFGLRGAVLVRPDGHVAWRMPWLPPDPDRELAAALTKLLR